MFRRCSRLLAILAMLMASASSSAQHSLSDLLASAEEAKNLAGEWSAVEGTQAGKALTKEQLAKVAFSAAKSGYGLELGPLVPSGKGPTRYLLTLSPADKSILFTRNIGIKGVAYHGKYEVKDDTLRLSLQLLPWERSTGDPSFNPIGGKFKADTVLTFKKVKKQ